MTMTMTMTMTHLDDPAIRKSVLLDQESGLLCQFLLCVNVVPDVTELLLHDPAEQGESRPNNRAQSSGGQATYFLNSAQLARVQKIGGLPTPNRDVSENPLLSDI